MGLLQRLGCFPNYLRRFRLSVNGSFVSLFLLLIPTREYGFLIQLIRSFQEGRVKGIMHLAKIEQVLISVRGPGHARLGRGL